MWEKEEREGDGHFECPYCANPSVGLELKFVCLRVQLRHWQVASVLCWRQLLPAQR